MHPAVAGHVDTMDGIIGFMENIVAGRHHRRQLGLHGVWCIRPRRACVPQIVYANVTEVPTDSVGVSTQRKQRMFGILPVEELLYG